MNEWDLETRILHLAGAIIAASRNVEARQAIEVAVRILNAMDNLESHYREVYSQSL